MPFLVSFLIFCFSYDNNNFSRFFSARSSDWERRFLTNCLTMSGIRFAQSRISSSCLAVTTVFERMDTKSVKAGTSDASARELPATYARHPAPGSGEASAPWSFSFPAYEESSLQDDCNHPNLTISTGDPRRPVRFIHNEGLSFLCVRMSGCACHPFRLIQDIPCCLLIPVHGMSAYRAEIRPVRQF